ncbi:MAG: DUF4426 domain-containing protein [Dokdonella sp.]
MKNRIPMMKPTSRTSIQRRFEQSCATLVFALLVLVLMPASALAQSDQSQRFDDITVYYSSLPADQLQPEVAQRYAVDRAPNRAIVDISLRGNDAAAPDLAGTVTGTAQGLNGQPVPLQFRRIGEDASISYLADFVVARPDTVRFVITLKADQSAISHIVKFQRDYAPE